MKLIMENWRSFLTEDNIGSPSPVDLDFLDSLEEEEINEAPKWMQNLGMAAALGAAGVGAGAGIGAAIDGGTSKQQATQQMDAEDDFTNKLVKRKGSAEQYMKQMLRVHSDSITDAPSSGNYKWIPPENISDKDILPYVSMKVKDYRAAQQKKDIKTLHKHLFGTSGMWGGSDMANVGGAQVLPPSWSITFDTYRAKVKYQIEQVQKEVDMNGPDGVAEKFGIPYEKIQKKLQQLQNTIRTK